MDKTYINLFRELTHATEIAAEQVMEYDHEKGDEKAEQTAKMMRDDYSKLYDKISSADFNGEFTKDEYAKLLAGAYIVVNNLRDRMAGMKKAIVGYETDLMPKLQSIIEQAKTDEEAKEMADKNFIIEDNK